MRSMGTNGLMLLIENFVYLFFMTPIYSMSLEFHSFKYCQPDQIKKLS